MMAAYDIENRILILGPNIHESLAIEQVFAHASLHTEICSGPGDFCSELELGAGAIILALETLVSPSSLECLQSAVARQPSWSDIPIVILVPRGADAQALADLVETLGNVTLLERPVRDPILLNLARAALRARARQYQTREQLLRRQETERAARRSEAEFRVLVDAAPALISYIDTEFRYRLVNRNYERWFGHVPEQIEGRHVREVLGEDAWQAVRPYMERALAGDTVAYEQALPYAGGARWVHVNYTPDRDPAGDVRGIVVLVNDISERKKVEEALRESEQRIRATFDNAAVGIVEVDTRDHFIAVNNRICQILGYTREELLQMNVHELTYPDDRPRSDAVNAQIHEGLIDFVSFEKRYLKRDGSPLWVHVTISTVKDSQGRILRHIGTVEDLSERKQAEVALLRQNERLSLLSEAAGYLLNMENQEEMIGGLFKKLAEPLGLDIYFNFLVHDQDQRLILDSCAGIPAETAQSITRLEFGEGVCGSVALTRRPFHVTDVQQSQDPRVHLLRLLGIRAFYCNPLIARGHLLGTLSFGSRSRTAFDPEEQFFLSTICHYAALATDRLQLETKLRANMDQMEAVNQRLADADQRKDEFLAMLAHELRNPLAPIRNAVQVLRLIGSKEPAAMRQKEIIDRQVGHMVRLVDDLLDVSRISRGKIDLKMEPVDLAEIIHRAIETVQPLIENRRHRFELCLPSETLRVMADPVRLAQVISNLLNNAAKYTDEGGLLWLAVHRENGTALIQVHDNGSGIRADLLPRLFELFSQAERTLDRTQGGLGIGLFLVRQIIELHGGSVHAWSAGPGQGSLFMVRLPLLDEFLSTPLAHHAHSDHAGLDEIATRPSLRVLIVEDNLDSAASLGELLQIWGQRVHVVHDGTSAVEAARTFRPDAVLLDIGLPGLNGYEVARRLRQSPEVRDARIIALTGYGQEEDRNLARAAGFNDHLTKPADLLRLQQLLRDIADHRVSSPS